MTKIMKRLTIEHNHGVIVLENAVLVKPEGGYQHAKGICVGGGNTSRLFTATSYKPFPTGVETTYPCYRDPWCSDEENDYWQASVVSCG